MRKGLTLMELLVVMSILATLAALLFPVYLRVRSRMYEISCANQLRQIGVAIKIYVYEHGDDTPYSMPHSLVKIYPHYVPDKDILVCPYFRTIAPEIVEEMHQICQEHLGSVWSSYYAINPKERERLSKKHPEVISFSYIFAKRGDQTPIVWCVTHQTGCPNSNVSIISSPKGEIFLKTCHQLYSPWEPIIILRWGGNVSFVHKQAILIDNNMLLLQY